MIGYMKLVIYHYSFLTFYKNSRVKFSRLSKKLRNPGKLECSEFFGYCTYQFISIQKYRHLFSIDDFDCAIIYAFSAFHIAVILL